MPSCVNEFNFPSILLSGYYHCAYFIAVKLRKRAICLIYRSSRNQNSTACPHGQSATMPAGKRKSRARSKEL